MKTPICDFIRDYAKDNPVRFHMPGHKGESFLGCEPLDITEIDGADSLFEARGIIGDSEKNAGELFGADTFYSAGGSTLCIQAMLYLAVLRAKNSGMRPLVFAARNAHKAFVNAAALLDIDIKWLYGKGESYLSCGIDAKTLESELSAAEKKPAAVYLTSPDYLGNMADIGAMAGACHRFGVLLIVDNAHGAYLRFLPRSLHPIDLGADICCDSAHKTLPVLTGGAYLHISKKLPDFFKDNAKNAMALFGSTSPSYLILQSLDMANRYIDERRDEIAHFAEKAAALKSRLAAWGYELTGDEPFKITINAKKYGYYGSRLAHSLALKKVICEFADPDYVVLMLSPQLKDGAFEALENALLIPKKPEIDEKPPVFSPCRMVMTVRQAVFSPRETIPAPQCAGRVLAAANVSCPPAVPIVVCGEMIDQNAVRCFEYYGVREWSVVISSEP